MLQGDELVAVEGEVRDADAPLLPDELGHGLELLLADVDKLAPVIYHACQQTVPETVVLLVEIFLFD